MFKINLYVRFAIIAVCLIIGIVLTIQSGFLYALPFHLAWIFFLAGYFLLGTITSTAQMVQTGNFEAAEKNLKLTIKPEWLYSVNRAYYHLMEGTIAAQKKDTATMQTSFSKALDIGLQSDNETAMLHLQLANVAASKNKWKEAESHFKKVKKLKVSEPMLKEQIQMFEKAFKQRGQMKHNFQGGGKQRRRYM